MRPTTVLLPKGRLQAATLALVRSAGYEVLLPDARALRSEEERGVVFQFVKPRSIPQLLHLELAAAGFVGHDVVVDSGVDDVDDSLDIGLGRVSVVVAAAQPDIVERPPQRPLIVATEYAGIAAAWFRARGLQHVVLQTHGSTEGFVPTFADVCVDCVETGETLRANGLTRLDTIMESSLRLCARRQSCPWTPRDPRADTFRAAITSALQTRKNDL